MVGPDGTGTANAGGTLWRLTEQQYRNSIADIFGEDIEVRGSIRSGTVSKSDIQEYERMAREIAAQVVDERHRGALIGCVPRDVTLPDDSCSAAFFRNTGRFLFRRPLPSSDVHRQMLAAREGTNASRDFYSGLGVSLAAMLVSPKFIFDIEVLEPVSARSTLQRLDAYSKASRLSLFLWNTTPDAMLLDAAERRDLHNASSVAGQVDRLLASHRAGARIKAFFSEASGDADGCGTDPVSLEYEHRLKPAVAACLTRRVVEIGLRRRLADAESAWLADLTARLVSGGYDMRPLLREIATSAAFFHAP